MPDRYGKGCRGAPSYAASRAPRYEFIDSNE